MSIFRAWRRGIERDKDALAKVLAQEPPTGAADIPLHVEFVWGGALVPLFGVFAALAAPIFFHFVLEFEWLFTLFFESAALLFFLASNIPDFTSLNRAVTISGEGVRLEKLHRSYVVRWWHAQSVQATPDLTAMRVIGWDERVTLTTETLPPEKRVEIAQALRVHARPHGHALAEWPRAERIRRGIVSALLSLSAGGIFIAGSLLFFPGGTLGMRCSVNSAFLQQTFDTPPRQGCVVLRVSAGAEDAGINRGDLVIEMEGYPVTSGQQFSLLFEESDPPWEFVVIRKGEPQPLTFKFSGGRGENFKEDPNDPFFYYLRGRWDADEKPEQAIEDYTRVIELEPRFDLAYLYRGELYEEKGERELARRDYEKALDLSPLLGETHAFFAYFIDVEDPEAARSHIETAAELDRCEGSFERYNIDCSADYLLLASLIGPGDAGEMAATAEQAIRFYDGFADNYFNAMCAYSSLSGEERARHHAEEYLAFPRNERDAERSEMALSIRDGSGSC